jgi:hypothetical protein
MTKAKAAKEEKSIEKRPRELTLQQEKFLHGIVEGKTRRLSYADAYGYTIEGGVATGEGKQMTLTSLSIRASETFRKPHVAARYKELMNLLATEPLLTLQQHMNDLLAMRNRAAQLGLMGTAVMAEIARGKAAGVHIETTRVIDDSKKLPSSVDDFV